MPRTKRWMFHPPSPWPVVGGVLWLLAPVFACLLACQDDAVKLDLPTQDEIQELEGEICRLSEECVNNNMDENIIAMCTTSSTAYVEALDSVCLHAYFPWRECIVDTQTNCGQFKLGAYRVLCDDEQAHAEDHCPEGTRGL